MGILDRGLAKLTLEAYQGDNKVKSLGDLKAMYNPESVHLSYAASFLPTGAVNRTIDVSWYQQVTPPELSLDLILDARGPKGGSAVDAQLSKLRALCFTVGDEGEPPFVRVTWGSMSWHGHGYFSGRVTNLSVAYTLFDRDAKPLRATASLVLRGQRSDEMNSMAADNRSTNKGLQLPDKTSLALLVAQATAAAGSVAYLATAYANDADNLSGMQAGMPVIIP